jgi:hypothetical protein
MLKTMLTIALLSCALITKAQDNTQNTYELRGKEQFGYIIDKDGNKTEGIVKLAGNEENPWMNQKKVKFIPKSSINPDKKRQRFKVLDADDINEYVAIEADGTERHFRKIKFTNKRESFGNSGGLGGKIKTIKNFASTTHMAEVILDGPITLYRLYGYPSPVAAGKGDIEEAKKDEENLRENPDLLVQKNNGKPKELAVADIKGLVSDCKVVSQKLASGAYSSYDPAKEEKKKSRFGKLVKSEFDRGGKKLLTMGLEIFTDYNTNCN